MRKFRLLKPDEIEVRVSAVGAKGIGLLLYKTARTDYSLLDETVGEFNWQNKYEVIDGKMYCGIGIKDEKTGEWIWKWNCGTESNMEAEKGQASDAMKRAGFAWGIGTELYSSPDIFVPNELLRKREGNKVGDRFKVVNIEYTKEGDVKTLEIWNRYGEKVFSYPRSGQKEKPKEASSTFIPKCKDCGAEITDKVHDYSVKKFGAPYCMNCQKNHAS